MQVGQEAAFTADVRVKSASSESRHLESGENQISLCAAVRQLQAQGTGSTDKTDLLFETPYGVSRGMRRIHKGRFRGAFEENT
jgi:hypothetical protein